MLVKAIIIRLSKTGFCRLWIQATGAAKNEGRFLKFGKKGSADISGILIGGKRIEIEVKTGEAVQEEDQVDFELMIKSFGGVYIVAHSEEEALKLMLEHVPEHYLTLAPKKS